MGKDWPKLIQVRERQKAEAMESLAAARREADATALHCSQAQHALATRMGERSGAWRGALARFASGTLDLEQLRRAGSFDAVASRRIVEAHLHHDAARARLQEAQAHTEHARGRLRSRCAALEKAERMDERSRAEQSQREERRAEEAAEAAALAAWLRRPERSGQ